jgi:hypothetical protein
MIEVMVRHQSEDIIKLDVDSFSDICIDNMTLEESDELVLNELVKLGISADKIISVDKYK